MGPKEKLKEFNQRFTTILNNLQIDAKVYANELPTSISMFAKRATKPTPVENFEEAKIIEFQMKGCKYNQISLLKKETK